MMQGKLEKSSQREPLEGHEKYKETGDRLFNELVLTARQSGKLDMGALVGMEESYEKLSDVRERYRCLVRGYRAVRFALVEAGNAMEAQTVKNKESLVKTSYYWRFGPRSSALWSWLTGPDGLKHFGLLLFSLLFFIFPILYGLGDFVASS